MVVFVKRYFGSPQKGISRPSHHRFCSVYTIFFFALFVFERWLKVTTEMNSCSLNVADSFANSNLYAVRAQTRSVHVATIMTLRDPLSLLFRSFFFFFRSFFFLLWTYNGSQHSSESTLLPPTVIKHREELNYATTLFPSLLASISLSFQISLHSVIVLSRQ